MSRREKEIAASEAEIVGGFDKTIRSRSKNLLNQEQLRFYNDNGYILIEGLLSKEEASYYRSECHALSERLSKHANMDAAWESGKAAVSQAKNAVILHCHNVQFYSAAFSKLIVDDRITEIASDIIGSPNVQLHHTKMFIKPPERGAPFPMHQDHPYFPHERHTMMAVILFFDDAPEEKGCVRVVPGSHKLGPIPHSQEGGWHLPFDKYPLESATACPAKAGDALFFNYLTIHGSGLNTSSDYRTTLLIQMRDPEDPPTAAVHESRGQGMILRGIDPISIPRGVS